MPTNDQNEYNKTHDNLRKNTSNEDKNKIQILLIKSLEITNEKGPNNVGGNTETYTKVKKPAHEMESTFKGWLISLKALHPPTSLVFGTVCKRSPPKRKFINKLIIYTKRQIYIHGN